MDHRHVPFNKPLIAGKELTYIARALMENRHTSGDGPFTKLCHEWLERRLGCQKALLTHSGTAALEMAALLAGIAPGDEVIMPSFTFVSTANAFVLRGAVPVFIDIQPDTLNLNPALIEAALTPKTRAIVPVHYAGLACDMDGIGEIARQRRLWVIEDAAQALLSEYKGRFLGTIGQIGCLSFHETKNVISGEGGALLINDPELLERAEVIWEKGTNRSEFLRGKIDKYTWVDVGSSYLPSDILAAFLYAQMEQADIITVDRNRICSLYRELLQPLADRGLLQLPGAAHHGKSNAHIFYLVLKSLEERNNLTGFLKKRGINAYFHYVPLHSSPAGRTFGRASGNLAVTEKVGDCLLRLPLYNEMTPPEVEFVVSAIDEFFKN